MWKCSKHTLRSIYFLKEFKVLLNYSLLWGASLGSSHGNSLVSKIQQVLIRQGCLFQIMWIKRCWVWKCQRWVQDLRRKHVLLHKSKRLSLKSGLLAKSHLLSRFSSSNSDVHHLLLQQHTRFQIKMSGFHMGRKQ